MTPLQKRFELWAASSEWKLLLGNLKDEDGSYMEPLTRLAFDCWVSSQADVIDMITRQDYEEAA